MWKRWFGGGPGRGAGKAQVRVLMVCMGNICRSPMAEVALRARLERAGLGQAVLVDSAGTGDHHRGEPPDPRAVQRAGARGYAMKGLKARGVADADFESFDLLLAMDRGNLESLERRCPQEHAGKLGLLLGYAPQLGLSEVPDPYYGSAEGFDRVLDLLETACDGLLPHLQQRVAASA